MPKREKHRGTKKQVRFYEAIDVWRRISKKHLVRYRCFRVSPEGKFCVQSADHYHLPLTEKIKGQHEAQFLELLAEQSPNKREKTYTTLEKAIEMFEKGFEESFGDLEELLAEGRKEERH